MAQRQYIISRKLNILELGATLGNISLACRMLGIRRQHFYDIKDAIAEEGLEGLIEKTRSMPRIGNRVAPEIEAKVLSYSLEQPTHARMRTANELNKLGITISQGGVRGVWLRHGIETKGLRLKRLEKWAWTYVEDRAVRRDAVSSDLARFGKGDAVSVFTLIAPLTSKPTPHPSPLPEN